MYSAIQSHSLNTYVHHIYENKSSTYIFLAFLPTVDKGTIVATFYVISRKLKLLYYLKCS